MKKQVGVIIVIFLFISVSFYPTIVSQSNDLTEITIELCGLKGTQHITRSITKTQFNRLKEFFESMKDEDSFSLSKLKNKIDTLQDFDIINLRESTMMKSLFSNRFKKTSSTLTNDEQYVNNSLCFTIGQGYFPYFNNYINAFIYNLLIIIGEEFNLFHDETDPYSLPTLYDWFVLFYFLITSAIFGLKPISLFNHILLDYKTYYKGWLNTYGLQGINKCEGWMQGQIHGFTGVKLWDEENNCFFMGLSLIVNLKYWETQPY